MKIFKVTIRIESMQLANGYPSEYYDVDGKICFRVKIFEEFTDYKVKAWTEEAVRTYFKDSEVIALYYLEDSENTWNMIAPANYVSVVSSEPTTKTLIGERDEACSPDVQEEYSKDPEYFINKPRIYSEF